MTPILAAGLFPSQIIQPFQISDLKLTSLLKNRWENSGDLIMNSEFSQQHQSHTQLQSLSITSSSKASTISNLTSPGDPKMEARSSPFLAKIRHDVYRLLVKRRYTVFGSDSMAVKPDMAILRTSKAISRETHKTLFRKYPAVRDMC